MKLLHIVAGLPPEGGGLSELVPLLAAAEAEAGGRVAVATRAGGSAPLAPAALCAEKSGVKVVRFAPSWPGFLFFSWRMLFGLGKLVRDADVVHVHGNWTFPVWWGCWLAIRCGKRLAMSPQGSFDPVRLRHSGWKKRLVGWIDRWMLRRASFVCATCEAERRWCLDFSGGKDLPCSVIPNGTEMPLEADEVRAPHEVRRVLFLGRIHPLKGLDMLLEAWRRVFGEEAKGWELVIRGPDERGLRAELERRADRLGISGSVIFQEGVYGADKWKVIRSADCFILPTRSENFGIAVAEALACEVPAICTEGAPWRELNTEQCGWWCSVSVDGIAEALRQMTACSDEERHAMGMRGRALVERKYTWEGVAKRVLELMARG